jgi:hypothetical protein
MMRSDRTRPRLSHLGQISRSGTGWRDCNTDGPLSSETPGDLRVHPSLDLSTLRGRTELGVMVVQQVLADE